MRDDRDYKVELTSAPSASTQEESRESQPFISVHFACCNVYCRVYRNLDGTRYNGRCPKCLRSISFVVGTGGTNDRFFVVS